MPNMKPERVFNPFPAKDWLRRLSRLFAKKLKNTASNIDMFAGQTCSSKQSGSPC